MYKVEESDSKAGARLVAKRAFAQGEIVAKIEKLRVLADPTYQTIQIGPGRHIEGLGMLAYMNHSCDPNVEVDTATMCVRAARGIAAGEPLTFFYPSTEWELDRPFVCACGSDRCVGLVAGARFLPVATLSRYFINEHIRLMILDALTPLDGSAMAEAAAHHLSQGDGQ